MEVKLYKSYGVLAHEKQPFYSVCTPASDIYEEVTVELPCPVWHNCMDEIGVTLNGEDFLLYQVLTNQGDRPALHWMDRYGKKHYLTLD